jgi:hypothetical protein
VASTSAVGVGSGGGLSHWGSGSRGSFIVPVSGHRLRVTPGPEHREVRTATKDSKSGLGIS